MSGALPLWVAVWVAGSAPSPAADGALVAVTSGGISLGAYQAGFLYMLVESAKVDDRSIPLFAGASAGAANSLLAGVMRCLPPEPDPTASLGRALWAPIGFDALVRTGDVHPQGMMSRRALMKATDRLWTLLQEGLPDDCRFVVGVSTTRVDLFQTELVAGLRIPRQEEKFSVIIWGRGPGRPVGFDNYVDPYADVEQPLLPFESEESEAISLRNYERLRAVIFASMAFPVAFPAEWVGLCLTEPPPADRYVPYLDARCDAPTQVARFVDGAVLDNSPIRHSVQLVSMGLKEDANGRPVWREPAISAWNDRRPDVTELTYVHLDPSLTAFPQREPRLGGEVESDVTSLMATLFGNFVAAARSKELYTLVEERDVVAGRLQAALRYEPAAGDPLFYFMGFFERSFREFDFELGMLDGVRFLRRTGLPIPHRAEQGGPEGHEAAWRRLSCMSGWLEPGHEAAREACRQVDRRFLVLLQTTIDRLWDACRRYEPEALDRYSPTELCRAAADGAKRPWVLGGDSVPAPARADGEWQFTYLMSLLARYGFEFRDLGLPPGQADRAPAVVRRKLLGAFRGLAQAQPHPWSRRVVESSGRLLANQLAYESPVHLVQLLLGSSLEATYLTAPVGRARDWFRLGAAVTLDGWTSWLTDSPNGLAIGLMAGPEFLLPPLTGPVVQFGAGLRGGYRFSTQDGFGTGVCLPPETRERRCSQGVVEPYLALSLVDRIRVQFGLDFFPDLLGGPQGSQGYKAQFGVGLLLY